MAQNKINTKYSFWGLLSKYFIQIPIIQRDYAQGRITEDVEAIRHGFLENLFIAISNNDNLDFDFIYGTIKGDNILEPLDGQQRLTTLFLLSIAQYLLAQPTGGALPEANLSETNPEKIHVRDKSIITGVLH